MTRDQSIAMSVAFARVIRAFGYSVQATREDIRNMFPALSEGEVHRFMEAGAPHWAIAWEADDPGFIGTDEDDYGQCYAAFSFNPLGCSILEKNPAYSDRVAGNDWRQHVGPDFNPDRPGLE